MPRRNRNNRDMGSASIRIAAEHKDLANLLSSKKNARDRAHYMANANVGVFELILDSYVLAASIGFANQKATPENEIEWGPSKDQQIIKEETVLNHETAKNLALLAGLLRHVITPEEFDDDASNEARLDQQITELTNTPAQDRDCWKERFGILDRYAHYGFTWLEERRDEYTTMEHLVFKAIELIQPLDFEDFSETDFPSAFEATLAGEG